MGRVGQSAKSKRGHGPYVHCVCMSLNRSCCDDGGTWVSV
jgi:hypothetical protein